MGAFDQKKVKCLDVSPGGEGALLEFTDKLMLNTFNLMREVHNYVPNIDYVTLEK